MAAATSTPGTETTAGGQPVLEGPPLYADGTLAMELGSPLSVAILGNYPYVPQ